MELYTTGRLELEWCSFGWERRPWNLARNVVSSLTMTAPRHILVGFLFLFIFLMVPSTGRGEASARTGFEVFLQGSNVAFVGRPLRLRGRAYEVLGLADLRAAPHAAIRARYASSSDDVQPGPWQSVEADAQGGFVVAVPIPQGARGVSRLEVTVGLDGDSRLVTIPLELRSALALDLRTDRVLYEPGEPVHVWVRLWDQLSLAPAPGVSVEAVVTHESVASTRSLITSAAGVASFSFDLAENAEEGPRTVAITAGRGSSAVEQTVTFRVGRRAVDRLSARLEVTPSAAAPEEEVTARVEVRTPSGAPVRGARVELTVDGRVRLGSVETDGAGVATVSFRAPAYLSGDSDVVGIRGTVTHPAHGSIDVSGSFRLARPAILRVDHVVPHGGLIPELDDELIISVLDAAGEAPPDGTVVEVVGAAVRGGRFRGAVDGHGFVAVPTRTPVNAVARHQGDDDPCDGQEATSVDVTVEGPQERTAHLCVPVLSEALVAPVVARPVVSPGEELEVRVERRPSVARRPVVVDLVDSEGGLVATTTVGPGVGRVTFTAPSNRLGLLKVRARPVLASGTSEGTGAEEAVIVRPAHPSFLRLEADRDVYRIRERVRLTVHADTGGGAGWVALLARDLAMHGGERPFGYRFLRGAFDEAVLDPSTPGASLLVRAALAAHASADAPPAESPPLVDALGTEVFGELDRSAAVRRGDLRDPFARAEELRRRGVRPVMAAIEQALMEALEQGTVGELTEGEGSRRRFRQDIVQRVEPDAGRLRTLGGGEITMSMLTAADPSFTFEAVARRVARRRLVRLLGVLAHYLDPEGAGEGRARGAASEPPERWLSRLVQLGLLEPTDLHDPWGRTYVLRRTGRRPAVSIAVEAAGLELLSPGPDGAVGTADDVRDPFARVVAAGTPYALASGEDELMEALSRLSPGEGALAALAEAYRRLSDEALEEALGDVASAGISEGVLGAMMGNQIGDNFGYGGLGLRGTGRGGGGTGEGTIGLGSMGVLGRGAAGAMGIALGAIVRERFPATLQFVPEAALDPSGQTVIELELADAVTTYVVEVLLWTADGWVWSGSTTVRVDQDVVVDAPVPAVATVGDQLRLPLRVAARTAAPQRVRLLAEASPQLALAPVRSEEVLVPGADAREVPAEFRFTKVGEGTLTVSAVGPDGHGLDATRRPVKVVADARRVRDELETIVDGRGELMLEVPPEALERDGSEVEVALGPALFRGTDDEERLPWDAWAAAFAGQELSDDRAVEAALRELELSIEESTPVYIARGVGTLWASSSASDSLIEQGLVALSDAAGGREPERYEQIAHEARMLLLLAPAAQRAGARPQRSEQLQLLLRRLRQRLEEGVALVSDSPWLWSRVAAALAWSQRGGAIGRRAEELLRRLERSVITVGDDVWLEGGSGDVGEQMIRSSALLALCEVRRGRRQEAFRLVRTAARLASVEDGATPEARALDTEGRALARAAAVALMDGHRVEALTLRIDGTPREVELEASAATIPMRALGRPGAHRVEIIAPAGAVALIRVRAEYGLPWRVAPPPSERGPLTLSIDGDVGVIDSRSRLRLVARNTAPRLVSSPIVEIDLPAGAEIDVRARERIEAQIARPLDVSGRTLTLRLRPLPPGAEAVVELPLRWSVSGRLRGLGAVGYAADRPRSVSVLPSREVIIGD